MSEIADFTGNTIKADAFEGTVSGDVSAADVNVAAGDDGLSAGTLQATLQDIYTTIAGLS
jgi:hypothetical protein